MITGISDLYVWKMKIRQLSRRRTPDARVLNVLARNYIQLMIRCGVSKRGCFCSKSYEDIFEDTIMIVASDTKAKGMMEDKDILDWFCFRFKMVEYQAVRDNRQLREVSYADDKIAEK